MFVTSTALFTPKFYHPGWRSGKIGEYIMGYLFNCLVVMSMCRIKYFLISDLCWFYFEEKKVFNTFCISKQCARLHLMYISFLVIW